VSLAKIAHLLGLTLALSGYAAWIDAVRPGPAGTPEVGGILLYPTAQAEALWHDATTCFVDVRPSIDYAYGHIAGALELPEDELAQRLPALRPRLEQARTVIVYCGSRRCARSLRVAMRLREAGLAHVQIYPAGWNEWFLHNLPVERTATR
jgi:rhodanese-related sulfurtransferase